VSPGEVLPIVLLSDLPPCRGHFPQCPTLFLCLSLMGQMIAFLCKLPEFL